MGATGQDKIKVLVVDDAVVIRKIVTDALDADPDIEVVGVAANGKIALQKIEQVNPDIITLDVEMPELNGLETLQELRKTNRTLPVIMFSTLTERGAQTTLDALSYGASDYCAKPANVGSVSDAKETVKTELLRKIKTLCGVSYSPAQVPELGRVTPNIAPRATSGFKDKPVQIVTIGVSTGGPNALAEVIPAIPADFPVPIVCVQHMPPVFTKMLAERLDAQSQIKVVEGEEGMRIERGTMYIAPGGKHMVLKRSGANHVLSLNEEPLENSCRPAVDPLFRSVADLYGGCCLGVILTGMGADGLKGCEVLKEHGAQVIAQDKQSSVVWGMPGFVSEAGLADAQIPLNQVAQDIVRRTTKKQASMEQ